METQMTNLAWWSGFLTSSSHSLNCLCIWYLALILHKLHPRYLNKVFTTIKPAAWVQSQLVHFGVSALQLCIIWSLPCTPWHYTPFSQGTLSVVVHHLNINRTDGSPAPSQSLTIPIYNILTLKILWLSKVQVLFHGFTALNPAFPWSLPSTLNNTTNPSSICTLFPSFPDIAGLSLDASLGDSKLILWYASHPSVPIQAATFSVVMTNLSLWFSF